MSAEKNYENSKLIDLDVAHLADEFAKVNVNYYQTYKKSAGKRDQTPIDVVDWEYSFVFPITTIIIPNDLFPDVPSRHQISTNNPNRYAFTNAI